MCGFLVISPKVQFDETRLEHLLKHRGPDAFMSLEREGINFCHWRLAILDLDERSNQPFFDNDDPNLILVYNGEIYNYKSLRLYLENQYSIKFNTQSDTEVIYHGFKLEGKAFIHKLNGIFSIIFYDTKLCEFTVVRDFLGVKPLYLYSNKDDFIFASEAMAIVNILNQKIRYSKEHLLEAMFFGYNAFTGTIYSDIRKIEPGVIYTFNKSGREIHKSDLQNVLAPMSTYNSKIFESNLVESVTQQLVSDVPVGVLNSGGLDSGLISTIVGKITKSKVYSYTAVSKYGEHNEQSDAEYISKVAGLEQINVSVDSSDVKEDIINVIKTNGEVLLHPNSIAIYLIAKRASKDVKVLLSGEGADELFEGYNIFRIMNLVSKFLWLPRWIKQLLVFRLPQVYQNIVLSENLLEMLLFKYACMPAKHLNFALMGTGLNANDFCGPRIRYLERIVQAKSNVKKKLKAAERVFYLPPLLDRQDRMLMAHGIEGRVPFLDERMIALSNLEPQDKQSGLSFTKLYITLLFQKITRRTDKKKKAFSVPITDYVHYLEKDKSVSQGFVLLSNAVEIDQVKLRSIYKSGTFQLKWNILNLCLILDNNKC